MALRELQRVAVHVALLALGTLPLHIAYAAPAAQDPLDGVKESIRLKQFAGAATELQRLAAAGNADAQYLLGVFYLNGLNGPRDAAQARPWLEKAAQQGNSRAILSLNTLLRTQDAPAAVSRAQELTDPGTRHEALWLAAERGDLQVVQALTDRDSLNSHDDFGRGALARAALAGRTDVVETLVRAGAIVDSADQYGITPLMLAARDKHGSTVNSLLQAGANVNLADHGGNTSLMHAAAAGDAGIVDRLLAANASVKPRNVQGWSALDFAEFAGAPVAAQRLSASGATAIRKGGTAPALNVVFRAKAPAPDLYAGWTDVAVAASRNSPVAIEALLRVDSSRDAGMVPALLVSVRSDAPRSVDTLFARNQSLASANRLDNALLLAIRAGEYEVVSALLAHGVSADASSPEGEPAIVAAARLGHTNIVAALTAAHANPATQDRRGTSAMMLAAQNANGDLLRTLLEAGTPLEAEDKGGRTALWYAAHAGDLNGVSLLLQRGASTDHADSSGVSPLAAACMAGAPAVAALLLARGAPIEARTKLGDTALLLATAAGDLAVVDSLLAKRADKDAQNEFGDTALIIAGRNGNLSLVKRLLAAGATTRIRNQDRATAADVAEARSFRDVAALLKG
ncbi:MAG: ankyrin repeat domain-containing protein [Steroidobacteraceae bacterium]